MAGTTEDPCGRETAENLARLSFPAGLGPAARARSAASHGSAEPFHQRLGEAVASGVAARIEFPGGTVARLVERVRFRNGTEAVHKVVYVEAEVHAEVLASLVGRALGARARSASGRSPRDVHGANDGAASGGSSLEPRSGTALPGIVGWAAARCAGRGHR